MSHIGAEEGSAGQSRHLIPGSEVLQESGINEFYAVPGLEDVDPLLNTYAKAVAERIFTLSLENGRVPQLIIPLNGGILPAVHVVTELAARSQEDKSWMAIYDAYTRAGLDGGLFNVIFAAKRPDDAYSRNQPYILGREVIGERNFIILDDIADELKAYAGLIAGINNLPSHLPEDVFSPVNQGYANIEMFAITRKASTAQAPGYSERVVTMHTIPNVEGGGPPWIRAGVGMNSGDAREPDLTARQRLSRVCYYREGEDQVRAQQYVDQEFEFAMLCNPDNLCRIASDPRATVVGPEGKNMGLIQLLTEVEVLRCSGSSGVNRQLGLAQQYFGGVLHNSR